MFDTITYQVELFIKMFWVYNQVGSTILKLKKEFTLAINHF